MSAVRLALMGIGDERCGAPIVASLTTFFWERPVEIRMYDADAERLDLFDRFARVCFRMTQATHGLMATESHEEALEEADLVVLSMGENCACKLLAGLGMETGSECVTRAVDVLNLQEYPHASILNLQDGLLNLESYYRLAWPEPITEAERSGLPYQILRWIHEEEYPVEILQQCEESPLKAWLENPTTAQYVSRF